MLIGILGTIVCPPFIIQGCCEDQMDIILLSKWQHSRQRALVESLLDSPCPEERMQEGFTNSQVCLHWGASFLLTCSFSFLLPLWQNCVSGSPKEIADSTDSWKKGSQTLRYYGDQTTDLLVLSFFCCLWWHVNRLRNSPSPCDIDLSGHFLVLICCCWPASLDTSVFT